METTKHHLWFQRPTWERKSNFHKKLCRHPGFIIPMPPDLHNRGDNALHTHIRNVPLITISSAKQLERLTRDIEPEDYLNNIGFAINILTELDEWKTVDNLLQQRPYIVKALERVQGDES